MKGASEMSHESIPRMRKDSFSTAIMAPTPYVVMSWARRISPSLRAVRAAVEGRPRRRVRGGTGPMIQRSSKKVDEASTSRRLHSVFHDDTAVDSSS